MAWAAVQWDEMTASQNNYPTITVMNDLLSPFPPKRSFLCPAELPSLLHLCFITLIVSFYYTLLLLSNISSNVSRSVEMSVPCVCVCVFQCVCLCLCACLLGIVNESVIAISSTTSMQNRCKLRSPIKFMSLICCSFIVYVTYVENVFSCQTLM